MLNMIRMELFRMFKTKSLYVIWTIFAVLMIVTTALTAGEMDAYSLEDRQQNYEYAMEEQESGQVNLGMDVTPPTKPGEQVSVFDMFFANIKGKAVAVFMIIFTILYSTAEVTSGFVKNIAGQVKNRGLIVCAKAVCLFLYTVLTMMLFFIVQAVANKLFFHEVILGDKRAFALYFLLQTILHFALLMIVMCIALVIRNNVVSIVIGICLCMNALIIFYSFIDRMLAKVGLENFHMINYTVSGKITLLGTEITSEMAVTSLLVGFAFVAAAVCLGSFVFKKRDI